MVYPEASDYKHMILIFMQVLYLLWVQVGHSTNLTQLYQGTYFLFSILEMKPKPMFSYCSKTSLPAFLTNLGKASSVGTGCQEQMKDVSDEAKFGGSGLCACVVVLTICSM